LVVTAPEACVVAVPAGPSVDDEPALAAALCPVDPSALVVAVVFGSVATVAPPGAVVLGPSSRPGAAVVDGAGWLG
jgi:hypothetical protein